MMVATAMGLVLLLGSPAARADQYDDSPQYDDGTDGTLCRPESCVQHACRRPSGPKTLFSWNGCSHDEGHEDEGDDDALDADRPDFSETPATVGLGRVQWEMGYTYTFDHDGTTATSTHSYPETLLRIGMFRDWFELRIGWNLLEEVSRSAGIRTSQIDADDLYLGVKLLLTEQCGWRPAMAIVPQMNVPDGISTFTNNEFMPGLSWGRGVSG